MPRTFAAARSQRPGVTVRLAGSCSTSRPTWRSTSPRWRRRRRCGTSLPGRRRLRPSPRQAGPARQAEGVRPCRYDRPGSAVPDPAHRGRRLPAVGRRAGPAPRRGTGRVSRVCLRHDLHILPNLVPLPSARVIGHRVRPRCYWSAWWSAWSARSARSAGCSRRVPGTS